MIDETSEEICSSGQTHCYKAIRMEHDPEEYFQRRGCRKAEDKTFKAGEGNWIHNFV